MVKTVMSKYFFSEFFDE